MPTCVRLEWLQDKEGNTVGTGPVYMIDTNASNVSTCAYVVQSGAEVANSPFALSAEEGAYLSAMVIGCWITAYVIRAVINVIKGSTE